MTLNNAQLICPVVLQLYRHFYSGLIIKGDRVGNRGKLINFLFKIIVSLGDCMFIPTMPPLLRYVWESQYGALKTVYETPNKIRVVILNALTFYFGHNDIFRTCDHLIYLPSFNSNDYCYF